MRVCPLLAFAAAALDEEADEVEEGGVSVRPVSLDPITNHRLLRRHAESTSVFTIRLGCNCSLVEYNWNINVYLHHPTE